MTTGYYCKDRLCGATDCITCYGTNAYCDSEVCDFCDSEICRCDEKEQFELERQEYLAECQCCQDEP